MKKYIIILMVLSGVFLGAHNANGQKYAFVDMAFIMSNIPAYEAAQEQLGQLSSRWEKEIQSVYAEVEQRYKNYQKEIVFLSGEMKTERENEIIELENKAKQLQRQETLMEPIQEKVSTAIREIADRDNLDAVFDMAGNAGVVYVKPRQDISNQILEHLGFAK
jgi:outer membrane protein